jgi:hypothetical protein
LLQAKAASVKKELAADQGKLNKDGLHILADQNQVTDLKGEQSKLVTKVAANQKTLEEHDEELHELKAKQGVLNKRTLANQAQLQRHEAKIA